MDLLFTPQTLKNWTNTDLKTLDRNWLNRLCVHSDHSKPGLWSQRQPRAPSEHSIRASYWNYLGCIYIVFVLHFFHVNAKARLVSKQSSDHIITSVVRDFVSAVHATFAEAQISLLGRTQVHTHAYTHHHRHTDTHTHTHTHTHINTDAHSHIRTHPHPQSHTHTHAHIHTNTHTHTHTHTCCHTHTRTPLPDACECNRCSYVIVMPNLTCSPFLPHLYISASHPSKGWDCIKEAAACIHSFTQKLTSAHTCRHPLPYLQRFLWLPVSEDSSKVTDCQSHYCIAHLKNMLHPLPYL